MSGLAGQAAGGDLSPGVPGSQVPSAQQATWLNNYAKALAKPGATFTPTSVTVPAGNYGPVPVIIKAEMLIAHDGSLDGYFQGSQQQLSTNTTNATMFYSDGSLWGNIAEAQGVGGDQWGVMNELWNFPGQVWVPAADVRPLDPRHQPHPPLDPPLQDHLPAVLPQHGRRPPAQQGTGRTGHAARDHDLTGTYQRAPIGSVRPSV